jgi:uncharacterized phage protein (TIGR01671 family)
MREIKFRARWKDTGKIILDFMSDYGLEALSSDIIIVEQFTGLLDKNGKKIYEGDIIKIPDNWSEYGLNAGEKYEIYFAYGGFRCKPKRQKLAKGYWLEDDKTVEIIGNIHETPELIS